MKTVRVTTVSAALLMFVAAPALGDWDPGDLYKMHFPQMPDPNGWAVDAYADGPADDWLCLESGPVSGIHFWCSWFNDAYGPGDIFYFYVAIYSNDSSDPHHNKPGELLWDRDTLFGELSWEARLWTTGDQGWLIPPGGYVQHSHSQIYQINIENIPDPFIQEAGTTYWLQIGDETEDVGNFGWSTSPDHFGACAVGGAWDVYEEEVRDPITGESLDLAFVIVPEPATLSLLALGGLGLMRRRRSRGAGAGPGATRMEAG